METIDVKTLSERWSESGIDLVDVRTPVEFREVHAEGARNVPLDSLDPQKIASERNGQSGDQLYLICRSGSRSGKAAQRLIDAGVSHVVSVEGGTQAWESAGLPVVRGKKAISLERQVRIVAGSLVVIGAALGFFVHPYFIGLSAFIGTGLVFAGVTDTCGMGMMLAKAPWNHCGDGQSCSV